MERTRVLIAEDEDLFRQMLRLQLSSCPEIEVVGDASNGEQAIELAEKLEPEVILMDIEMGEGLNGIQAGKIIKSTAPTTGIVLLSSHNHKEFVATIVEGQAAGWSYLLKKNVRDANTLVRAINGSSWGIVALDPQLTAELKPKEDTPVGRLTDQQVKILELLVQGYENTAIARKMGFECTVDVQVHLITIYRILGIASEGEVDARVRAAVAYLEQTRSR